jgi:two-component system, OmpR family, sensor histidine kinase CiaH
MIPEAKNKRTFLFAIYWMLLAYIVAALVWWFIALNRQNEALIKSQLASLTINNDIAKQKILKAQKTKTAQYIGEGATFLVLILVGAFYLYRTVKRALKNAEQQRSFMMAITHELKTPIAVTKLNLETLQRRNLNQDLQQQILERTVEETNRLDVLCNNLLLSSKIDSPGYVTTFEEINFSNFLDNCCKDAKNRFPKRNFVTNITREVNIRADVFLMQILVNNLIENAVKYSPKEKSIYINLQQINQQVQLQIIDEGLGISNEEKQLVFKKFYRMGNQATKNAKGTGLGLYLAKRIAQTHDANITIQDNPNGGCIFNFTTKAIIGHEAA